MTAIPEELFNRDGAIYMGAQRDPAGCQVGLFGVPYDGTTSFRPGTRFGPAAIRQVSDGLETYDPQLDADLDDIAFADLGAVEISFGAPEPVVEAVKQATTAVLDLGLKPLMLGGEHSISSGAVAAVAERHPDLVLLQLDAHADLRESWLGAAIAMPAPCGAAWRCCPAVSSCNSPSAAAPRRNSRNCGANSGWWGCNSSPSDCRQSKAGRSISRLIWIGLIPR